VPALREVLRLTQREIEDLRAVAIRVVVRDAIHHHLAQDRSNAVRLCRPEGRVHARLVHGAVGEDGRGAGLRERPER
jgi:hypothetical protein